MSNWWTFGTAIGLQQRSQPLLSSDEGVVLEAQNIAFTQAGVCVQRYGSVSQSLTGSGFTGSIEWGARNITEDGTEERWAAANNNGTAALAMNDGTGWVPVSFSDTPDVSKLVYMQAASLNGKFFIAYKSDVNRLHVWDPNSGTLRRAGFGEPGIVGLADLTPGALSFTRWYRMRYLQLDASGNVIRRSEPGPSQSIIIVNKIGAQVTKGAALNEGETDWEIEAADVEDGPYYVIATQVVGNQVYDDLDATINTSVLSPLIGEYLPPPSAKYLLSDGQRLLMAGAWEDDVTSTGQITPKQNRIWFTPVLGTTDEGDDERIPFTAEQENLLDVGDAGPIVGLAGPLYGDIYCFKVNSVWKLVPLEDLESPFRLILITDAIGAIDQRLICSGEQGDGIPAIYFAAADTIYRISQGGMSDLSEPISRDIRFANFIPSSSVLGFDPFDDTVKAQTNIGSSAVPGQYFQFDYDIKSTHWSGMVLGEGGAGWILGRSILGSSEILGPLGTVVRSVFIAQNDNGQSRLHVVGADPDGDPSMLSLGDQCALDGSEPFTSRIRVRRYAADGHKFAVGSPTLVYRNPIGDTQSVGTLTVELIRDDGFVMAESITMETTPQDDPTIQKRHTFSRCQMDDALALDVRITMSYTVGFLSAIPPSIDAVIVPEKPSEALAA